MDDIANGAAEAWNTEGAQAAVGDAAPIQTKHDPAPRPRPSRKKKPNPQTLSLAAFMSMLADSSSVGEVFAQGEVPLHDGQDVLYVLDGIEVKAVVVSPAAYVRLMK